jgi:hypothetical protein
MNATKLAAGLMIYSGLSHPSQLLIYGTGDPALVQTALIGSSFLLVGLFLLTGKRAALWVGALLPLLFGLGALGKILFLQPNIFTYIHTAIDFIVAGLCIYQLRQARHA